MLLHSTTGCTSNSWNTSDRWIMALTAVVVVDNRNLSLKFGPNQVSNRWNIVTFVVLIVAFLFFMLLQLLWLIPKFGEYCVSNGWHWISVVGVGVKPNLVDQSTQKPDGLLEFRRLCGKAGAEPSAPGTVLQVFLLFSCEGFPNIICDID